MRVIDQVDVAVSVEAMLGESPVWDAARNILLWVDIDRHEVNLSAMRDLGTQVLNVSVDVGAAFVSADSNVVLAATQGFFTIDVESEAMQPICRLPDTTGHARMNDGAVDPGGRIWAGTVATDGSVGRGHLYRVDNDGTLNVMSSSVTASNGIGWSPDHRLMYYIDSATQRVDVFDYEPASGSVTNRRPFVHIAPECGTPDGLEVDSEGCVWVAIWGGAQVRRFAPDGRVDTVVRLPTSNVTSCCFGGSDLDILYVTSAARDRHDQNAGSIFECRPGVVGMPPSVARVDAQPNGQSNLSQRSL